jgi:hypothetical protein
MPRQAELEFSRRQFLRASGWGLLGASMSGWLPALAQQSDAVKTKKHCILLWMSGDPSQLDTFDLKPGHENGGEFKPLATSVPGLQFSEHLPKLAAQAQHLAIVRSMSTKEGDHGRGTYLMRTGYLPGGPVEYPTLGASLSKELGDDSAELPNFVSISPVAAFNPAAFSPGFLGSRYAAATVGPIQRAAGQGNNPFVQLGLENLHAPAGVSDQQADSRLQLWDTLEQGFASARPLATARAHQLVYQRAVRLMKSQAASAFDLEQEPIAVREAYGRGRFGQGCLLARRLVERGVPFVEVTLGGFDADAQGWDTHQNNFSLVKGLSGQLDAGWSCLLNDLRERGLLESTTIVWMGEFGRTPRINSMGGRDHYPNAWTCALAGGGVRCGQAYGSTSADGMSVSEHPVSAAALLATVCASLGIDPETQNTNDLGRPIKIVDAQPIRDLLA